MTKTPDQTTLLRTALLPLAIALIAASGLAQPSRAIAATYAVDACQRPDGLYTPVEGWLFRQVGEDIFKSDNCARDGSILVEFESGVSHGAGDAATWVFAAPPNTTLERLTATRLAAAGVGGPSGTPEAFVRTNAGYIERCRKSSACTTLDGPLAASLNGASEVQFGVACEGGQGGRCPAELTTISLKRLHIELRDDAVPTLTDSPSGSLTSTTSIDQTRSLVYRAADLGGGVFWQRLLANGNEVASAAVNNASGKCERYPRGNGFTSPTPCPGSATGGLSYDTAGLSDGAHGMELRVFDATDVNYASRSWNITVDNVPPIVSEVTVSGAARDGEMLRCAAVVDGQSPQVTRQWVRGAVGGADATDVPGATGTEYTLSGADIGKQISCRVAATDGGGTTTRSSSQLSGPFAGSTVVAPKPGPYTPGGSAAGDPTPGGANGNGGGAGAAGVKGSDGAPGGLAELPACARTTVTMDGRVAQSPRSYSRSAVSLSGRLTAVAGGKPVGGAMLNVMQTVTRAGASRRTKVGTTRTAPNGSFTARVPRGPTRKLQLVDPGCGAVGVAVAQRVRGVVQVTTQTPRLRNKQLARFHGRVLGGYVGRGLPLELQVKVGRTWRDVKAVTSNSRGDFKVTYRFLRTFVRYTYRFRVVSRGGSAWPYGAARSREVRVRVN